MHPLGSCLFSIIMWTWCVTNSPEWLSSGRKRNSLPLDIWLRLIIEKDSCLFIDLSSVPYFGALYFFSPSLSLSCLTSSNNSECSILCWGVFSNTGLTQQSSFAVIRHCFPNFVSENEAALGHGIWLCASKRAKPFGVKQDRDNKRGGDTMWEGSGSACLSARLLFVFLSDKSI